MIKKFLICVFALAVFIWVVFGAEIDITAPENTIAGDNTPDLNVTFNESVNVTYSWDSEGNISGCRNCTSYNTTYGEYANSSEQNLTAVWHFNENFGNTTFDDSGNNNNGTLGNGTAGTEPSWTTGVFGPALEFDGVDDQVQVPDSGSLDLATNSFTFAGWMYPKSWAPTLTDGHYIFTRRVGYAFGVYNDTAGGTGWYLYVSFKNGDGSGWSVHKAPTSSTAVPMNSWSHLVARYDYNAQVLKMYLNGIEEYSAAEDNTTYDPITADLEIGKYSRSSPPHIYFNGTIDEVAIFNRSFSDAEIRGVYAKSLSDGYHCVTVYANDTAGNLNSTERCFTVDTIPTISITAPADGTISDTTPDLNFTISETVNVTYSWDSEGNISGCRNCTSYNTNYGENNGSDTKLNALFHFNENFSNITFDDSGNGNDGTLGNATPGTQPAWTSGKFGPALEFNGVDDFVNVSDSSSLDFTENLTMSAWLYPRFASWPIDLPTNYTGIIGKENTYALGVLKGKLRISLYNGSKWTSANSPDNVSLNQWVHIAGTFNGSWMKLYVNGTEVKSQAVSADWGSNIITTGYPLQFGYYPGQTYFNGTIDEVAIFNRSFSDAEIQGLYAKSLSDGPHCVTVYANDTTGNFNSEKRCFTVSALAPAKMLLGTNRFSVWAPYSSVTNYEADESSFKFRAGALVMDQNGEGLPGVNVTFKVYSDDNTLKATITNTTGANGIVYMVYNTKGDFTTNKFDTDYGTWQVVTMVTSDTSINATRNLQIDAKGWSASCGGSRNYLCHNSPSSASLTGTSPKSPYSDEFGTSTGTYASMGSGSHRRGNHGSLSCEFCHSGYGSDPGAPTDSYPWGAHSSLMCTDANCHGGSVFSTFPPNMPSCYGGSCHPEKNDNLSTVDTTVTVNGITDATVYSWNHELKAPLMAHTTNKTYNMSKGIPCWICHGPMHNITKPDPVASTTNTYTEDSQCKTCHSPKTEHNDQVKCTTCHSQDAHNISFFNATGSYTKNSGNAGDCTTCHQQTTAWDTLLTQPKVGTYSGSGPPQVPVPLNHSDNATGQRWGSYWTTGNDLSACNYCHGDTKHSAAALGRPANWSGANTVNSSINATNNWCAGCHYQGYASGSKSYSDMTSEFTTVPPEITSNPSYAPTGTAGYFNHSLGDYSDKTCSYCHDGLAPSATNVTALLHNVGTGKQCESCHFSWSKMSGTFGKSTAYMNETRFNQSVHGTPSVFPSVMFCTSCHTTISNGTDFHLSIDPSVFTPPQSGWKWCEDCHVVNQTTPASNRHNLTDNPATNMFNSTTSVMGVTDCKKCHDATRYDSAKATYNKTSGKDCRFCHTFPDLSPGGD